jgi:hypothetical protein
MHWIKSSSMLLALTACTHSPSQESVLPPQQEGGRQEMTGLEDMALEYIISVWGKPDNEEKNAKGRTIRFKDIKGQDHDPLGEKMRQKTCDIRLEVNAEDLVVSWVYENCRYEESSL